jgi:hypothetical protein
MKISIHAPYAKERFESARQHSILHLERVVRKREVIQTGSGQSVPGSHFAGSDFRTCHRFWADCGLQETVNHVMPIVKSMQSL